MRNAKSNTKCLIFLTIINGIRVIFIMLSKQIIRKKKKNKKADAYQFDTITILLISEKILSTFNKVINE